MKNILVGLSAIILVSGCGHFKTVPQYTVDGTHTETLRNLLEIPVNIGEFVDTGYRKELTCRNLAVIQAPNNQEYVDMIRYALIDELTAAGRYDPKSPVTIKAQLNRIDFDTVEGFWVFRMTLFSSNGQNMQIMQKTGFNIPASAENYPDMLEAICSHPANAYQPAMQNFMKALINSNEFVELAHETLPPLQETYPFPVESIFESDREKAATEAKILKDGHDRIRHAGSLNP